MPGPSRTRGALYGLLSTVAMLAAPSTSWAQVPTAGASATLLDRGGHPLATADLREQPDQVLIALTFTHAGALIGEHAIQIHERGQCTAPDFGDAGGIFNPQHKEHGLLDPAGPMVGDLPDLVLGSDGATHYNLAAPLATLRPGPNSLLNSGGTSLVIADGPDDNRSQPDGNSGARIACGVIMGPGQAPPAPSSNSGAVSIVVGVLGALLIGGGVMLRASRHR